MLLLFCGACGSRGGNEADILIDEAVVLTIGGDGVTGETTWTLGQLQGLGEGYRSVTYSTTNNWPTFGYMAAEGISLTYLLQQEAGLLENAACFKFISTDGYYATLTYDQVFGKRYTYAAHSALGSSGATIAEPLIAWVWGDAGSVQPENIRSFFGQIGPWEVNTASFVKDLCRIEVSAESAGTWETPEASIPDGAVVPSGTELELLYSNMDNLRIYYTLDGSEPDYDSAVYNPSTSYFQPYLITPLILEQSVTVKAFAAGHGRDRSPVAAFTYTIE